MGRIVIGQVIAGSGPDRHGEGIDKKTIRHLFEQIKNQDVGGHQHNLAVPPIVRAFNYRLEETPDGKLLIKADLEILNEEVFAQMGGFSISYTRLNTRIGHDKPAAKVLLNPQHFDYESAVNSITKTKPEDYTIDVTEKIEKAVSVDTAIIIISLFALNELSKGFLSAAGADLYTCLRKLTRKDEPTGNVTIQINVQSPIPLFLDVAIDVSSSDFSKLEIPPIPGSLPPGIHAENTARVVGRLEKGPSIRLLFAIMRDGSRIPLGEGQRE